MFEGRVSDLGRLTCKSVKDTNGDIQINPGMLPLSHKNVCCIDSIEKIDQVENVIVEVIERRSVSVAKKGGLDVFECDTTLIATCEPKSNRLTSQKSVLDNFPVSESLLNKFDLAVLVLEEDKRKQNNRFKTEFGISEPVVGQRKKQQVASAKTEGQRVEFLIETLEELTTQIDQVLRIVRETAGDQPSKLLLMSRGLQRNTQADHFGFRYRKPLESERVGEFPELCEVELQTKVPIF